MLRGDHQLGSWSDDAKKAIVDNPAYFGWWDLWKTRLLVVTLLALGAQRWKSRRRRRRG